MTHRKLFRSLTSLCIFVSIACLTAAAQNKPTGLAGNWLGTLEIPGGKLRLVIKVAAAGDGYTAKMDSPDQGAADLPVSSISLSGDKVSLAAPQFGITFEGGMNAANDEITGTFSQRGGSTPFTFKRIGEIIGPNRPQTPAKPYPYAEEELTYRNTLDNVKLVGTLTIPKNGRKQHPAVILISGSGSQDRDSTVYAHKPFLVLADHLTRQGIAVLRVDDRGSGSSDAGSPSVTSENFMHDVLAGVDVLKKRPDIDPSKIGLVGHSEGGMIAPMAAAHSKDVAFIVLLAGPGQTGSAVVESQTRLIHAASGTEADMVDQAGGMAAAINSIIISEPDPAKIETKVNALVAERLAAVPEARRNAAASIVSEFRSMMPRLKTPWYRYFVSYDPVPVLKKVKVPVLAVNGELDLQVPVKENLDGIRGALAAGGNKDVTIRSFPKLNHLFQTSTTGLPREYASISETMSPEVLTVVSDWIKSRTLKAEK